MDNIGKKRTGNEPTTLDPEAENCAPTADGRTNDNPTIVSIGASAGGPAAFQSLLPTRERPQSVQDRHHSQLVRQNEKCTPRDANRTWKAGEFVDSLIEMLDCCGVLTDEQANILYVRGDVSPYFKLPEGSILERLNAVEMSRPPIRFVLQSITRAARLEMTCRDKYSRIIVGDAGSGFDPQGMWTRDMDDEMGFGLFNIRERLQLIGGAFEIVSRPGIGTTVTLTAPLQKGVCVASLQPGIDIDAASGNLAPPPSPRREIEIPPGKVSVMLVDDHAVVRNGLSAMLAKHNRIEIAGEAADGEEAIALARRIRPDVILMDINMPKLNGVEATRVISAELPGTRIYALSMYDAQDQAAQMTEAGATGYLNKDGNMNDLLAVILQTVSHPPPEG